LSGREIISWCGESLEGHMAATALMAWRLYSRDWRILRHRLAGLLGGEPPAWILLLVGALHDAGKASPCYQERALESCRSGGHPSFSLHEYLSAYAGLALARVLEGAPRPLSVSLYASAAAALLHHHGMSERILPARDAEKRLLRLGCLEANGRPKQLRLMTLLTASACRLLEEARLTGIPLDLIVECRETVLARGASVGEVEPADVWGLMRDFLNRASLGVLRGFREVRAFRAMTSFLTGATSLADTVAASLCRRETLGGYAARVLAENARMQRVLAESRYEVLSLCRG
jgi:CRISPR-associated endonuclease Cas3-HD